MAYLVLVAVVYAVHDAPTSDPWRGMVYMYLFAPMLGVYLERAQEAVRDERAARDAGYDEAEQRAAQVAWFAQAHPMSTLDDTTAHLTTYMHAFWPPALGACRVHRAPPGVSVEVDGMNMRVCRAMLSQFSEQFEHGVPLSVVQRMSPVVLL
jgi:hypothetical protein